MKMKYTVKFEFYGRNMKTTVEASSREAAKEVVRKRLTFHEVTAEPDGTLAGEMQNGFDDLLEVLTGKKKK
jgi:hypothetical protein